MSFGRINARLLPGIIFIAFLHGCASTPQTDRILKNADLNFPRQHIIENVQFFPQKKYQCGPAALATMLNFLSINVSPDDLRQQVYVPQLKGSLQIEMIAAARAKGLLVYPLEAEINVLLQELAQGHPVLVLQNLAVKLLPRWHYAVVIGYDLDARELVLHSGTRSYYRIPMATFERTWQRADHWAYVMLWPGQIPATAKVITYLKASHDLQLAGHPDKAAHAYHAAVHQWPDEPLVFMALGNSAYSGKDYRQAELAFKTVINMESTHARAWNNLAYTFQQLNCHLQAVEAVTCASKLEPADKNIHDSFAEITRMFSGKNQQCTLPACPVP